MNQPKIILLATEGDHLNIVYNYLKNHCHIETVIVEPHMSRKKMLQYRIKKLGVLSVVGQVIFILFSKIIDRFSSNRKTQLLDEFNLSLKELPSNIITHVPTVNSKACRKALQSKEIDFVFVVGTRIIGKRTIESINHPFVNIHAGITPKYRGVHGAYWALVNDDKKNCGVTLHYVDTGVDTGDIIGQTVIDYNKKDNFTTYPINQAFYGLELLKENLQPIIQGVKGVKRTDIPSKQWFHPTIWLYIYNWLTKRVK